MQLQHEGKMDNENRTMAELRLGQAREMLGKEGFSTYFPIDDSHFLNIQPIGEDGKGNEMENKWVYRWRIKGVSMENKGCIDGE